MLFLPLGKRYFGYTFRHERHYNIQLMLKYSQPFELDSFLDPAFINKQFAHCKLSDKDQAESDNGLSICIQTSIGRWTNAHQWGDYHFAIALRKSLTKLGYNVTIRTKEDKEPLSTDILIYLRGLRASDALSKNCFNIMWNISHPADISMEEYKSFNHVFVASNKHTETLKQVLGERIECLLQCSDPEIFTPISSKINHDLLFVGNSRKVFREIVALAVDAGFDLSVYGSDWESFLSGKILKGTHVQNSILNHLYSGANIVLNDHWVDMREYGFISNRIFDAMACEATVVSDFVEGIDELFGDRVITYRHKKEFESKVHLARRLNKSVQGSQRENILEKHTFDHRAQEIHEVIKTRV